MPCLIILPKSDAMLYANIARTVLSAVFGPEDRAECCVSSRERTALSAVFRPVDYFVGPPHLASHAVCLWWIVRSTYTYIHPESVCAQSQCATPNPRERSTNFATLNAS